MITSYEIDLRILFGKFYCSQCGGKLKKKKKIIETLNKTKKEQYYKELYPHGVPIKLDVARATIILACPKCNIFVSADEQLKIAEIQKRLRKKILAAEEE